MRLGAEGAAAGRGALRGGGTPDDWDSSFLRFLARRRSSLARTALAGVWALDMVHRGAGGPTELKPFAMDWDRSDAEGAVATVRYQDSKPMSQPDSRSLVLDDPTARAAVLTFLTHLYLHERKHKQ